MNIDNASKIALAQLRREDLHITCQDHDITSAGFKQMHDFLVDFRLAIWCNWHVVKSHATPRTVIGNDGEFPPRVPLPACQQIVRQCSSLDTITTLFCAESVSSQSI